jgi:TolB protein
MGLWLVDAKGHTALVVVNSHNDIVGAAVSPDGQKVAYKFIPGFGTPGFGTDAQLRWINADGSNPQGLSTVPSVGGMWSPDGQWIAFGFTLIDLSSHQVHTLPVLPASKEDAVNFGYFEPASGPVLSPDRRMMAYVLGDNTTQQKGLAEDPFRGTTIHVVDVAMGEHRPLTQDNAGIDPAWSPDGKQIVFVSKRSGTPELWAVNVDGSNLRQLTQGNQLVRYPIWRKAQKPQ